MIGEIKMDWTKFNTHGQSFNDAFEVMCNVLFEGWCKSEYKDTLKYFSFVNGKGGDGGVEAYGLLDSGEVIGVQSKQFPMIGQSLVIYFIVATQKARRLLRAFFDIWRT